MTDILKKAKEERYSALYGHRHSLNTINVLHMGNEIISDQTRIKEIFQEYYMDLLYRDIDDRCLINMNIVHKGQFSQRRNKTFFHYLSVRRKSRKLSGASLKIKPLALMALTVAPTRLLGLW